MTSVKATLHTFERKTPADAAWQRSGPPEPAVVGAAGIGWSEDFDYLAKKDEPVKREGDKRTPAGIFRVAGPFGFEPNKISGYTKLEPGRSFCVDDPTSLLYGRIVSKQLAAKVKSSEDMSTVPGLKRGADGRLSGTARRQGRIVHFRPRLGRRRQGHQRAHRHARGARRGAAEVERARASRPSPSSPRAPPPRFKGCLPLNSATSSSEHAGHAAGAQSAPRQGPARRADALVLR